LKDEFGNEVVITEKINADGSKTITTEKIGKDGKKIIIKEKIDKYGKKTIIQKQMVVGKDGKIHVEKLILDEKGLVFLHEFYHLFLLPFVSGLWFFSHIYQFFL
jgi:hypothetical protein